MFTDRPPPLVAPDTRDGRLWAIEDWDDDVAYCRHYRPYIREIAVARPNRYTIHECQSREPFGDRNHNWCFRCPAGFMFSTQHVYDAEHERDRVMFGV